MSVFIFNPELETQVIHALMIEHSPTSQLLIDSMDILDVHCFTSPDKQKIFDMMQFLHIRGHSISEGDLLNPLLDKHPELISFLQNRSLLHSANNLFAWSQKLCKLRDKRNYINLLQESIKLVSDSIDSEQWEGHVNEIPDKISKIQNSDPFSDRGIFTAKECVNDFVASLTANKNLIKTGITDLDNYLDGGFRAGSLVAIGAPPSAGKTQFAAKLVWGISTMQPQKEALIFSMEMSKDSMTEKLIEIASNEPLRVENGYLSKNSAIGAQKLACSKISICDKSPVTVSFIRSAAKRAHMRGGVSVILVDYLDRVKKGNDKDLRTDEKLSSINIALADIAKDFNCIVILLTQLNKAAINKTDKRPTMNDSKNTNGTAETADYWFGIKRIGQWDIDTKYSDSNLFELILDKNRYGRQGIIYFLLNNHLHQEINQHEARKIVLQAEAERSKKQINSFNMNPHIDF